MFEVLRDLRFAPRTLARRPTTALGNTAAPRTREPGVRMALGAHPRAVANLVISHGIPLVGVGAALGLAGGLGLGRTSAVQTTQTGPDALAFVAVTLVLVVAGMGAMYIPARRVTRIDPMVALRHE